jgi:hypothetical protein
MVLSCDVNITATKWPKLNRKGVQNRELRGIRGYQSHSMKQQQVKYISLSFIVAEFTRYYWNDKIEENEVRKTCGACGGDEKGIQNFSRKSGRKEVTWKNKM